MIATPEGLIVYELHVHRQPWQEETPVGKSAIYLNLQQGSCDYF